MMRKVFLLIIVLFLSCVNTKKNIFIEFSKFQFKNNDRIYFNLVENSKKNLFVKVDSINKTKIISKYLNGKLLDCVIIDKNRIPSYVFKKNDAKLGLVSFKLTETNENILYYKNEKNNFFLTITTSFENDTLLKLNGKDLICNKIKKTIDGNDLYNETCFEYWNKKYGLLYFKIKKQGLEEIWYRPDL